MKSRNRIQPDMKTYSRPTHDGQFHHFRACGLCLAFGILSTAGASAQATVYNRSDSGTGLWWSDSPHPWWYGYTGNRPDIGGRNDVIYDHNNNLTSTVNGAFFNLRTLTLASTASSNRTFNSTDGGGISLSVGFTNNSAGIHQFNVPIGVDGTTVAFTNNGGAVSFTSNFYLNANTAAFSGAGNFTLSGPVSGSGGVLSKSGTGTLTLSNTTNGYTGATSVNSGKLIVTGAIIASSGVSVSAGATLAGESGDSGVSNGKVSAITLSGGVGTGGILAPGNGTAGDLGTLYGTSLAWNGATTTAFSQMKFDLGSGNASDKLVLSGAMTKGTGSIFEWDFGNTGVLNSTYTLVTAAGGFGSGGSLFSASNFTYKTGSLASGLTGSFSISGNNLTFTVVPEPTSALAGLLITAGLLRRRRA
jgi:autotransporter-associated beta strand protein